MLHFNEWNFDADIIQLIPIQQGFDAHAKPVFSSDSGVIFGCTVPLSVVAELRDGSAGGSSREIGAVVGATEGLKLPVPK